MSILILNNNSAEAELLTEKLRELGVDTDIRSFQTIPEVNDFLQRASEPPAVIFVDLNLAESDPLQALADWKLKFGKAMLFVLLTDDTRGTSLQRAYASGADSFLVKPPAGKDLENLINFYSGSFLPALKENKTP